MQTAERPGRPGLLFPAMADPDPATAQAPAPVARRVQPTKTVRKTAKATKPTKTSKTTKTTKTSKTTKTPAQHKSASRPASNSKPRSNSRSRPAPVRHTNSYLLAHLPPAKNKKAAAAVHEALALIGVPYRWGGTTRAGFDCSGFTQHVWGVAGVKIPRTVRAQAKAGTHISLNKAEPGDLVVFYPAQHHVGIYVGNGLVIDSPHTGAKVRPDPVRSMPVSVVVRVKA